MPLNEADTRAQLIEPKLLTASTSSATRPAVESPSGRLSASLCRRLPHRRRQGQSRVTHPRLGLGASQPLRPRPGCALCLRDQRPRHRRIPGRRAGSNGGTEAAERGAAGAGFSEGVVRRGDLNHERARKAQKLSCISRTLVPFVFQRQPKTNPILSRNRRCLCSSYSLH
jgi:hypothetical protein